MTVEAATFTPLTPLGFLGRAAAVFPDKVAISAGTRRYSYAEFATEATRVAHGLRACGVQSGDRVAYLSPNLPELLVAHFAVPLAGAVLVAVNIRLSGTEIGYILAHSDSRVVVVHSSLVDLIRPVVDELASITRVVVTGDPVAEPGLLPYADLVALGSDDPLPWAVADELSAISVNYTSGTTGRPKGVVYTHRGAYLNSFGELLHSRHTPDSVYLWTLPMFHCNGWCTAWAVTAIGGRHVCLPSVTADEVWRLIDAERVTHLNAAPTVLVAMANSPAAHPVDRPLVVTTAGAPPSPTVLGQLDRLGIEVVHVYGLTETYGPYSVCEPQPGWTALDPRQRAQLLARQGVGMIQTDGLRVVDPDLVDVPADGQTMGEIVMRGNNVMAGYLDDPAATETAFRGGWFHSGDLGVRHPDGYVELRDRSKDVIISGGENISTVEVELAIDAHPAVLEVAVVGMPDDRWGERPKAYVVLRAGLLATEAEIIEHVRDRLAHYKAPDRVEFVAALPKTATGKIQKFQLRDREWAGHARRING